MWVHWRHEIPAFLFPGNLYYPLHSQAAAAGCPTPDAEGS